MLVLFESPAGYAIFKMMKGKKLQKPDNVFTEFDSAEKASKLVKLKHFEKFTDMKDALKVASAVVDGKINKKLKKLLKRVVVDEVQEELAVADAKLGNAISSKFNINCVTNTSVQELMRCIREHLDSLIEEVPRRDAAAVSLGLAHSLCRYKLKFSPDKVDTMIVQAIGLLDDLDKELNNYIMRCKEWYGWHFPELSQLVVDNQAYVKTILALGFRNNVENCDLSDIVPEDVEEKIKTVAEISMGTDVTEEDMSNIKMLCEEIVEIQSYRTQLFEYLSNRMMAIAPNLTVMVGELVGARLIAHAGSLLNLAKHPASTVQILGAEKALFRAIKSKQDTPKYGLIYHTPLVGQASALVKGKVSRMIAGKAALACRVDALGEDNDTADMAIEVKAKLERRVKHLAEGKSNRVSGTGKMRARREKYDNKSEVFQYKDAADSFLPTGMPKKRKMDEEGSEAPKKKKLKVKEEVKEEAEDDE